MIGICTKVRSILIVFVIYDFRYSSLDRKSQKNKVKKQVTRHNQHPPTKSTSLGNFNFIHKQDDTSDAISVTSAVSDQRKVKEKQW